jgi:hypothetical protein
MEKAGGKNVRMPLKLWNGRWSDNRPVRGCKVAHAYVAAFGRESAIEMLKRAGNTLMTPYELKIYWSKGAWGTPMQNVTPEPGVWVELEDGRIERLI